MLRRRLLTTFLALALFATPRSAHADNTPDLAQSSGEVTANAPAAADAVFVHVDAHSGTELRTRASVTDGWTKACVAPCDCLLPRDAHYQVVEPGRRPSSSFDLRAKAGDHVDLSVSPNRLGLALGLPVFAFGALATYIGVKILEEAAERPDSTMKSLSQYYFGPFVLAGGVPGLIAGAVLPFVDTGTTVSQTSRPRGVAWRQRAQSAPSRAPTRDAFLRAPTWSASSAGALRMPAPTLPLTFSWTF